MLWWFKAGLFKFHCLFSINIETLSAPPASATCFWNALLADTPDSPSTICFPQSTTSPCLSSVLLNHSLFTYISLSYSFLGWSLISLVSFEFFFFFRYFSWWSKPILLISAASVIQDGVAHLIEPLVPDYVRLLHSSGAMIDCSCL